MPGKGAPHAIFLPRQKRQARRGFFTGVLLEGIELRPIDGDGADFERNSVVGVVDGPGVGDVSDGGCDRLSCGESRSLRSANRSRRMTPSWQSLGNFNVGGFI